MSFQLLVLMVVLAVMGGCVTGSLTGYSYDVAVKNIGKDPIPGSVVTSAQGFWHEPGYLGPEFGKTISGPFKQPYADKWTVTWKTAKGEKFEKTLDLTKAFSKPFQGRLVFVIDGDNNLSHMTQGFSER